MFLNTHVKRGMVGWDLGGRQYRCLVCCVVGVRASSRAGGQTTDSAAGRAVCAVHRVCIACDLTVCLCFVVCCCRTWRTGGSTTGAATTSRCWTATRGLAGTLRRSCSRSETSTTAAASASSKHCATVTSFPSCSKFFGMVCMWWCACSCVCVCMDVVSTIAPHNGTIAPHMDHVPNAKAGVLSAAAGLFV